ncbi:MAG: bifunctional oligoribonuclease/PAP phosphatase NrnA, partial [Faecousia sp.]
MKKLTRAETAAFLAAHNHYLILTHARPDGDTIGSAAALCRGLRSLGKTAQVLENRDVSPRFQWLHQGLTTQDVADTDCIVSVDVASPEILHADFKPLLGRIELRIDHHSSATSFTDCELVDPGSASCAELVYDVLTLLGCKPDRETAEAIYVGASTDTGC